MFLSAGRAVNKLYHLKTISASRFYLSLRTNCSEAASSSTISNDTNAKAIYSLSPAMGHIMGEYNEFNLRVPVILSALGKAKLTPEFRGSEIIQLQNTKSATLEDISTVHSKLFLYLLDVRIRLASQWILEYPRHAFGEVNATTFEDSAFAAGACLSMIDSVVSASKLNKNPPVGFALIEPPIHHTEIERGKGYCVFANIAIAARYAQRVHGLKRVLIIDFDAHYVYETNETLYDDPDIFSLSIHEDAYYDSHSGNIDDIGRGNAEGTTLNVPLPNGSGDIAMQTVFDQIIVPAAQRFKPDIILVSAGYDGHSVDPTNEFQMTTGTYYMLATGIKQLAKDLCGGRCVFIVEGGYNQGIVSFSVAESLRAFLDEPSMAPEFEKKYAAFFHDEPSCEVKQTIEKIKSLHSL